MWWGAFACRNIEFARHRAAQVAVIIDLCRKRKLVQADPYFPKDPEESFYVIYEGTDFTSENGTEERTRIEGSGDIDGATAMDLVGDEAGIFGAGAIPGCRPRTNGWQQMGGGLSC
eukprot:7806803-Alexandrium_andersonii.AAC.1